MQVPSQRYARNGLLAVLTASDYEALKDAFEPVALARGDILVEPDQPFPHVTFVETGVVSAVSKGDGRRIEIGLVGRDGFVGVPLALGVDRSPHESIVQIEGTGLRLSSAAFSELLDQHPAIRMVLLRYAHLFQLQTAQTALSNGSYSLEERLARWLLMCGDRMDGDEFPVTHEFLAFMLGVRRPGVTTTVHILEGAGMIRARRSRIQILDRAKLEEAAGESYGTAEAEYRRLIVPGAVS